MPQENPFLHFQFDLVCDKAYLSNLATTIYFCGVMLGGILFGTLSDHWGRKPFTLGTLYLHIVVGVLIAFSNSYVTFVILRFLQGVLMQVNICFMYIYRIELFFHLWKNITGLKCHEIYVAQLLAKWPPTFTDIWWNTQSTDYFGQSTNFIPSKLGYSFRVIWCINLPCIEVCFIFYRVFRRVRLCWSWNYLRQSTEL